MSFLENPFAEEEVEEVIPEEPFGDYDEDKRENDYNTLVIRARVLDGSLEKNLERNQFDLDERIKQNAHLREAFESERYTWASGAENSPEEEEQDSAAPKFTSTVYKDSNENVMRLIRKRNAIRLYEAKLATSLVDLQMNSTSGTVVALPVNSHDGVASDQKGALIERIREALSDPEEALGGDGSPEEYQLLVVLCGHLHDALLAYTSLVDEVQHMEGALALKVADCEKARKLLCRQPADAPCGSGSADTKEVARLLGVANGALQGRIDHVEKTLALYERRGLLEIPTAASALWPVITAAKLESQKAFFLERAEDLASEVVALRSGLRSSLVSAGPTGTEHAHTWSASTFETQEEATRLNDVHKHHRLLRQRIEALRGLCLERQDKGLSGEMTVALSFLEKFVDVQDAFLHSMAILNSHFKKQASNATYLQRIFLHDAELDAGTFSRVLDIQRDACAMQSEILSRLKAPEGLQPFAATENGGNLEDCKLQLAFCHKTCDFLKQQVEPLVVEALPSQVQNGLFGTGVQPRFCIQEDVAGIAEALEAEVEDANAYNAELLEECKAVLTQRQNELEKKLTWLERQRYAKPLVELYHISKEIEQLHVNADSTVEEADTDLATFDFDGIEKEIAEEETRIKEMNEAIGMLDTALVSLA